MASRTSVRKSEKKSTSSSGNLRARVPVVSTDPLTDLHRAIGNRALQLMLAPGAKGEGSPVSQRHDAHEIAADRAAERVLSPDAPTLPTPFAPFAGESIGGSVSTRLRESTQGSSARSGSGRALEATLRADMESRFGDDFRGVRIHTDSGAVDRAALLRARAFTVGEDVFFGRNEFVPTSHRGRTLLAHELAHVIQQRSRARVDRDELPPDQSSTPDLRMMPDAELHEHHELLLRRLSSFNQSTPESAMLLEQIANVGAELGRRRALAEGRTFSDSAIATMRSYFVDNAKTEHDSCIVALNKGMKKATGDTALPTTPKSIEASMEKVEGAGFSENAREIGFTTKGGTVTRGGARPNALSQSVWDTVLELSAGDPGWSVFTMSLLDGYHSVTLTLDATNPASPHIYWSDQWQSKGGWKEYSRAALDAEVTRLIQNWWDAQPEGKKHKTVVRLWRLRAVAEPLYTPAGSPL